MAFSLLLCDLSLGKEGKMPRRSPYRIELTTEEREILEV